MAEQKSISNLAKMLGEQIADAHKATKDAAVDRGVVQVPGGINNGIFQLTKAYITTFDKGDDKSKPYFRASGVVKTPDKNPDGIPCKGLPTSIMVRLFPQKAFGQRPATTFNDQWQEYLNFFKMFEVEMPPDMLKGETKLQAATRIEQYLQAATAQLLKQKPHCTFSTREYTPPVTPANPKPKTKVYETWHGKCEYNGHADPGAGVDDSAPNEPTPPTAEDMAPPPGDDAVDVDQPQPPDDDHPAAVDGSEGVDLEELARVADADMAGKTPAGKAAIDKITELALANGATMEQVNAANNWTEASALCVQGSPPDEPPVDEVAAEPTPPPDPVKGSHVIYKGAKHEVMTVNLKNQTVTLRNVKTKTDLKLADKKTFAAVKWSELS